MSQKQTPLTLEKLAATIGARVSGDGSIQANRLVHPSDAKHVSDLALAMEPGFLRLLNDSAAGAAVVSEEPKEPLPQKGFLIVDRSRYALAKLTEIFSEPPVRHPAIHPNAVIDLTAEIGSNVSVGPFSNIGPGAKIGARTVLQENVTVGAGTVLGPDCLIRAGTRIGDHVTLGKRVICQPNVVIGADGFSYVTPDPGSVETAKASGRIGKVNSQIVRIYSLGTVVIGDDVELGAGVTIDRGTVSATRIGQSTKLDNQVQVGHNVVIGENCMICGQVGIAGSAVIGDRVVLAGQVGIADHVTVGADSIVTAKSGVARSIKPKSVVAGYPARDKAEVYKEIATLRRQGKLVEEFRKLKNRLIGLENRTDTELGNKK
ncbi:MAG: UDP-3-O-(3-hydroxymyristoyl)glucosamine N-acyltransferase [Pseudomonadota bacterium]|nr:UDP-3-O-(3-hydroxymyristoyl)glucosamine N-acyltransferase [Pseudomonadota bacterium]